MVTEILVGFRRWLELGEKGHRTVRAYEERAKAFIAYQDAHGADFMGVDPEGISLYMQYLLIRKGLKAGTRSQIFYALMSFYNYLVSKGLMRRNPVAEAPRVKPERRMKDCLTNDEVTKMIYAPGLKTEIGMRDTAILTLLTALGNRATALCNLTIKDIRVEEVVIPPRCSHCGQIDYSGTSSLRGRKAQMMIVRLHEKGGKEFSVPIHDKAAFYLNKYLVLRAYAKDSDIVFPRYQRKVVEPINRHGLYAIIRKYARAAGVKGKVSPHSFRHAAATWLLDCGVNELTVKNLLGHSSLTTTERYRHVSHRAFIFSGAAREKNLLEAIDTPMDGLLERAGRV